MIERILANVELFIEAMLGAWVGYRHTYHLRKVLKTIGVDVSGLSLRENTLYNHERQEAESGKYVIALPREMESILLLTTLSRTDLRVTEEIRGALLDASTECYELSGRWHVIGSGESLSLMSGLVLLLFLKIHRREQTYAIRVSCQLGKGTIEQDLELTHRNGVGTISFRLS